MQKNTRNNQSQERGRWLKEAPNSIRKETKEQELKRKSIDNGFGLLEANKDFNREERLPRQGAHHEEGMKSVTKWKTILVCPGRKNGHLYKDSFLSFK